MMPSARNEKQSEQKYSSQTETMPSGEGDGLLL